MKKLIRRLQIGRSKQKSIALAGRALVFMWDSFGPMHVDRCRAVAKHFAGARKVIGIELGGRSDTYDWPQSSSKGFEKHTLFPEVAATEVSSLKRIAALLRVCTAIGSADFFFCHYEQFSTFATSVLLRLLGKRVFVMNDSKYDDKPRRALSELFKLLFYLPYSGALLASKRSGEYLEFLHFPAKRIAYGYDTISIARIQEEAGSLPAPQGKDFRSRHFTVVARMVPKKNLAAILEAFSLYVRSTTSPRLLHFCGGGPLELEMKSRAEELGLTNLTIFHGSLDAASVSKILGDTLALILMSEEEQFGLVIPEALAMGVPVIVSKNCGACDDLVRSGVNGFVVEPDNPIGVAYFMGILGSDVQTWTSMARAAAEKAPLGDVNQFVKACEQLIALDCPVCGEEDARSP
jgi:glycosyltransferase involved in cell wall biosynthesis